MGRQHGMIRSLFCDDPELSVEVEKLVTFKHCPELLRGSSLYNILRCGGQIFDNSSGSERTYQLSEQVERLDGFFSHNWSCPRIHKLLCLVLHFNLGPAFWGSVAWCVLLIILTFMRRVPSIVVPDSATDGTLTIGVLGYLTPLPVFAIIAFGCHEIFPCFPYPCVFLDKTCIHQEDKAVQRMGIEKLGAFLASADSVIVCYTPVYLQKLRTIYEAATFLCLKDVKNLHVIPFQLPWVFWSTIAVSLALNVCSLLFRLREAPFVNFELVFLPIFNLLFAVTCRRMAHAKAEIRSTLASFSIDACNCFDERDRPVVYRNISSLMRSRFKMPKDTTEEEALSAFEELVRTLLPAAFAKSLGRANVPYKYLVMVCILTIWPRSIDHAAGFIWANIPFRLFLHIWGLMAMNISIWMGPLCLLTVDYCASCCLHWRGAWGMLWATLSSVAGFVVFVLCYTPGYIFVRAATDYSWRQSFSEDANRGYNCLLWYTLVGCTLFPILFSGVWRRVLRCFHCRRAGESELDDAVSKARETVRQSIVQDLAVRRSSNPEVEFEATKFDIAATQQSGSIELVTLSTVDTTKSLQDGSETQGGLLVQPLERILV